MNIENAAAGRSLRILFVEDHDSIARACHRLLTGHGHHVTCVATLAAATSAARDAPFDILISDLSLPDGTGLELLPLLRTSFARVGPGGRLPAIAMSGSVSEEDVARSLAAGFAAHLAKPFEAAKLLAAVRQAAALLERS